jgi:ATP-dependent Zn protease
VPADPPQVKELLGRNRAALDALTAALLDKEQLQGPAVYTVLEPHLTEADRLAREQAAKEPVFL